MSRGSTYDEHTTNKREARAMALASNANVNGASISKQGPRCPDQRSRVSDTTFSYVWIASFAPSIRVCRARACLTMSMSVHRLRERCV